MVTRPVQGPEFRVVRHKTSDSVARHSLTMTLSIAQGAPHVGTLSFQKILFYINTLFGVSKLVMFSFMVQELDLKT